MSRTATGPLRRHTQARARATGREGRVCWAAVFTITGGKVSRYRVYEDTGTLALLLATA